MARVLVVGAGNVGRCGLHEMAQYPEVFSEIYVLTRTLQNIEAVNESILKKTRGKVHLIIHQGDAGNLKSLLEVFRKARPKLVINWGPPYYDLKVMDACLEYGVDYIDTANFEDEKKLGFDYKPQWAKNRSFIKKDLLAILGIGFDPGVTNVFSAYARDYLFDEVHTIDILDCNGGSKNVVWAPNFDPEINIRELILRVKFWARGKWHKRGRLIDKDAIHFPFKYPETGVFDSYLMYHEEEQSLVRNMPHLKRIRFWMTFSEEYLTYLRVLHNIGMTGIEPVDYNGHKVVPVKFLKTILPKGDDFNESYRGNTCIGNIISGVKNGKQKVVYIYSVDKHRRAFLRSGGNAVGETTAWPTVNAAMLYLLGKWGAGVTGVRNVEDPIFDSRVFLDGLDAMGMPWKVVELKKLPESLKKDY